MLFKKLSLITAVLLATGFHSIGQLTIQSGATFHMQTGAVVTVEGNVDNAGTLNNDGSLKVQGNYSNTGSYTGVGSAGVMEIYGTGNSNISAGASTIANLVINKTGVSDVVKLLASATVSTSFTHTNGIFTTDPIANPAFALVAPATANFSFAAGKEIVGKVTRTSWTGGTARVFNQPNMQVTTNAGTAPTDVSVMMIPSSAGGDPTQGEREVKRKYNFSYSGGSGFNADVRYPYLATELNTNVEANLVPWRLNVAEWNARLTPVTQNAANDYVSTTGISAAELVEEWKLADPNYTMNISANLRGPWNNTNMNTTLNTGGIIPLSQPYNISPFNYAGTEAVGSIPANVVDWILIEHRKPLSGLPQDALAATISGREAGFLLNNGTVVGLDGVTPIDIPITKQGNSFIVVRHRNHLGVISNVIASNALGTFANDFSSLANVYKPAGAPSDPMVLLGGGAGKYGLWAGDANKSGSVNATDVSAIRLAIASSATGYLYTDVNLTNSINASDVSLTRLTIAASGSGSGNGSVANPNGKPVAPVTTNIPDPIVE